MLKRAGRIAMAVLLLRAAALCQGADQVGCRIPLTTNKEATTLRGKIGDGAHDVLLLVTHCDAAIVLVYAGDTETDIPATKLNADKNLRRFRTYTEASYKPAGKGICMQCAKYEVEATLTGLLEVATIPEGFRRDNLGFLRDMSGKVVGVSGFGHPNRPYKYRMVIESVSDVVAQKRPKPGS
jgi:hypothetical protein